MSETSSYQSENEFSKLLQRRSDVNLAIVALELGRDAYPQLDFAKTLSWIEQRGQELAVEIVSSDSDESRLKKISTCLAGRHGVSGCVKSFQSVDGSFLHRAIEQQHGLPITLSILYHAVADHVGITLHGVAAPMHFLLCYLEGNEPLYLDPFSAGEVMTQTECLEFLSDRTDFRNHEIEPYLKPARPRDIVIRMLNNLKALYSQEKNWRGAYKVQQRLYALEPADYQAKRDMGIISVQAGETGKGWRLLNECLSVASPDEQGVLVGYIDQAEKVLSQWN